MRARALTAQTRRHALIVSMLGIRHVVLAVNKMDLVGWSRGALRRRSWPSSAPSRPSSACETRRHSALGSATATMSSSPRSRRPGTRGPTLLRSSRDRAPTPAAEPRPAVPDAGAVGEPARSRFPRPMPGLIASGSRVGRRPRPRAAFRRRDTPWPGSSTFDGDLRARIAGQSVTLVLADELDAPAATSSRAAGATPDVGSRVDGAAVLDEGAARSRQGDEVLEVKLGPPPVRDASRRQRAHRSRQRHAAPASEHRTNDIGTDVTLASTAPSPSIPTARAARPGASSSSTRRRPIPPASVSFSAALVRTEACAARAFATSSATRFRCA